MYNMEKLVVIQPGIQDTVVHIYDVDSDTDVTDDVLEELGFNPYEVFHAVYNSVDIKIHNKVL